MPGIQFLYKEAAPNPTLIAALQRLFAGGAIKRTGRPLKMLRPGANKQLDMQVDRALKPSPKSVLPPSLGAPKPAPAAVSPKPSVKPLGPSASESWSSSLSPRRAAGGMLATLGGYSLLAKPPAAQPPSASPPAAAPTAAAAPTPAADGTTSALAKYAPLAALGGLGAYGLYRAYDNMFGDKADDVDFVPKSASAEEFTQTYPLVAGFLAKCAADGCDMRGIVARVKMATSISPGLREAFAAAFEKHAILEEQFKPSPAITPAAAATPQPQAPLGQSAAQQALNPKLPDMKPPAPAAAAPPPAAASAGPPKPEMPTLPPDSPYWVDEQGAIHAEPKPTAPHQPIPINMRIDESKTPSSLSRYGSQLQAFYNPMSDEYANVSPNDTTGRNLRIGGRVAGGIGLAAGAGAAGLGAGAGAMATAGSLGATAGKTYLGLEGMTALNNATQLKNPLTNTLGHQVLDAAVEGNPIDARIKQLTGSKWAPADVEKNHGDLVGLLRDRAAEQGKVLTDSELMAEADRMTHNNAIGNGQTPPGQDPFMAASQTPDLSPTPHNEQTQAMDEAFNQFAQQNNIAPEQLKQLRDTMANTQNIDKPTVDKAWENLQSQVAQTNPQVAQDPNILEQLWNTFQALPPGAQLLLASGLGVGLIGALNMLTDPNSGLGSSLMTLAGLGTAGLTAAHHGMLGESAKNLVQPLTGQVSGGINDLWSALGGGGGAAPEAAAAAPGGDGLAQLAEKVPGLPTGAGDPNVFDTPDATKLVEDYIRTGAGDPAQMDQILQHLSPELKQQLEAGVRQRAFGVLPETVLGQEGVQRRDDLLKRLGGPQPNQTSILDQYQQSRFGGGNPNIPQAA